MSMQNESELLEYELKKMEARIYDKAAAKRAMCGGLFTWALRREHDALPWYVKAGRNLRWWLWLKWSISLHDWLHRDCGD